MFSFSQEQKSLVRIARDFFCYIHLSVNDKGIRFHPRTMYNSAGSYNSLPFLPPTEQVATTAVPEDAKETMNNTGEEIKNPIPEICSNLCLDLVSLQRCCKQKSPVDNQLVGRKAAVHCSSKLEEGHFLSSLLQHQAYPFQQKKDNK